MVMYARLAQDLGRLGLQTGSKMRVTACYMALAVAPAAIRPFAASCGQQLQKKPTVSCTVFLSFGDANFSSSRRKDRHFAHHCARVFSKSQDTSASMTSGGIHARFTAFFLATFFKLPHLSSLPIPSLYPSDRVVDLETHHNGDVYSCFADQELALIQILGRG
jgi:hypothetical protein